MNTYKGKLRVRGDLLAALVAVCCTGYAWAAPGDVCVDVGGLGYPQCEVPTGTVTTNDQGIDTGAGSIVTTDVTASGTVQGSTLTDGAGASVSGGDVNADDGTFTGTLQAQTLTDGAGASISGGDVNADDGTFTGTVQAQTLTDGTVSLSNGVLTDGTSSITMDGTDTTVDLNNSGNSLQLDASGAGMSASDGATTGSVAVTETEASVTVDNGTASHGLVVGTSDTVLSGGTTSTRLTLDDAGAHLDNRLDMGDNRITSLADGIAPTDAVTMRQLNSVKRDLESGIAVVAAISAIPDPLPGHRFSIGVGTGFYEGENSLAVGFNADLTDRLRLRGGIGASSAEKVSSVGIGFSW